MAENSKSGREKKITQVYLVDDHPVVRQGLARLIDQEDDLAVCGESETGLEAYKQIPKIKPDIAVVDISLKDMNGIELIKDLKARMPDLPILGLSMHDESVFAERVIRAGAMGYIMKEEAATTVLQAIRRVVAGQIYLSSRISSRLVSKFLTGPAEVQNPLELLSDRELEVFQLIGQGFGTRQIAEKLHLSVKTIETYRANIKEKLKLKNATELLQHAIQWAQSSKL